MISFLYLIILFQTTYAIEFNYSEDIPEVLSDDIALYNAFLGGVNHPVIRWGDWDQDSDIDLFLLDEDGHIRYYENIGTEFSHQFIIADTDFLGISNITWFYIADFDNDQDLDIVTQYDQNASYLS